MRYCDGEATQMRRAQGGQRGGSVGFALVTEDQGHHQQ